MSNVMSRLALPAMVALALLASAAWSQDQAGNPVEDQAEDQVEDQVEDTPPAEDSGEAAAGEAQAEEGEAEQSEAAAAESGPAVGLDEIPELDQQTYEQDDDEFIPTEEIPVDQSIPFPTDI